MKTNTIKQNKTKLLSLLGIFFVVIGASAQMQNNGPLHIGSNATVHMKTGNFSFGTSATTTTLKSPIGVLSLGASATSSVGSTTQFVDGWMSTLGTVAFTFPIGQKVLTVNYYAPVKVIPALLSTGVSASYYRTNPNDVGSTTTLDASLAKISALEYWKVMGSNAKLTLTWNLSSNVISLTTFQLADVTIAGYNISTSKWETVSSSVDVTSILGGSSSITTGSVTSTTDVILNNYSAFSIGLKGIVCPELVASTSNNVIPTVFPLSVVPTLSDIVTINTAGSFGSFVCNSLVLNADLTLLDSQTIEVVNGITGTGKIIMSSTASLMQRATGVDIPNIQLTKATRFLKQFDYTYFGSPTNGDVLTSLLGAISPAGTVANAFEMKYKYVSGIGGGWVALTTSPSIGQGYIARVKNQAPFTTSVIGTDFINTTYTGTANNGDISVGISYNSASPNGATSHNLLANPYPSALDADKFLQANTNIDGVVYLWSQQTPSVGLTTLYNQADYIAYTRAGSTAIGALNTTAFAGKIASGQGFMVKALSTAVTNTNVLFTNCMRVSGSNTQFNRVVNETPIIDRYKVNMTGNNGVFSQIVVAYLPEGTMGYDRMYDAGRNSVSTAQLYSILENDGRKLAINARPNFVTSDIVPLGVSKSGSTVENFTLSIQEKEGVFASATPVFVHDMILNTYTDLTLTDYTFSSNSAAANNRFEIVYQNGALSNPSFEETKVLAFIENGSLSVVTSIGIKSIEVYDITGRKITSIIGSSLNSSVTLFNYSEGIYIAKIKLSNGVIATQKLINKK